MEVERDVYSIVEFSEKHNISESNILHKVITGELFAGFFSPGLWIECRTVLNKFQHDIDLVKIRGVLHRKVARGIFALNADEVSKVLSHGQCVPDHVYMTNQSTIKYGAQGVIDFTRLVHSSPYTACLEYCDKRLISTIFNDLFITDSSEEILYGCQCGQSAFNRKSKLERVVLHTAHDNNDLKYCDVLWSETFVISRLITVCNSLGICTMPLETLTESAGFAGRCSSCWFEGLSLENKKVYLTFAANLASQVAPEYINSPLIQMKESLAGIQASVGRFRYCSHSIDIDPEGVAERIEPEIREFVNSQIESIPDFIANRENIEKWIMGSKECQLKLEEITDTILREKGYYCPPVITKNDLVILNPDFNLADSSSKCNSVISR